MSCNTATRCLKSRASPCDANCGRRHTPSRTRRSAARSTASLPDTGPPSAGRLRTLTPTTWADTPGATRVVTARVVLPILNATRVPRCPAAAVLTRRAGGAPATLCGGTVRTGARTGTIVAVLDAGTLTRIRMVKALRGAAGLVVGSRDEGWKEKLSTRRGATRRTLS